MDNGETRIVHVASELGNRDVVVVTFSEMWRNNPDDLGFGEKFLIEAGIDVIAVRKRRDNWYQDLSLGEFVRSVGGTCSLYRRSACYGASMGGFAALFYGGSIGASIISVSPMVSIHPDYPEFGSNFYRKLVEIKNVDLRSVPKSKELVTVVYDPMKRADLKYVTREVIPAFQRARVIRLPYTGHPSTYTMAEMNLLQPLVLQFIRFGTILDLSVAVRHRKAQSIYYLWNLARRCAASKKFRIATTLYQCAIARAANPEPIEEKLRRIQLRQV
ncbi:hypothetical protein ACI2KH_25080 [Roseomonas mucosa]|uniref:hypothetical protein n=2 Tax=Roseomonas TaxID=125216 RepID=UPI003850C4C9